MSLPSPTDALPAASAIAGEVADRLGVLPNFFCTASAAPGLIDELWAFAKSAYLDSPLPSLFKEGKSHGSCRRPERRRKPTSSTRSP